MDGIHRSPKDDHSATVLSPALLNEEHVADIVERLNAVSLRTAVDVLSRLPDERAVEVLDQPELDAAAELVAALPADRAVHLLAGMSADRTAEVFRDLEEPVRSQLMQRLDLVT